MTSAYRIRWAGPGDVDALAELADLAHGADERDGRAPWVARWVRDLMAPCHPQRPGEHMAVAEERATQRLVSMACVIPQTWTVGQRPILVGRLEAFGTHPEHRRRGLVRRIIGALQERGAELGCHLEAISGLPWFYRQFGYDYGLAHEGGWWCAAAPGVAPGVSLRPMVDDDVPAVDRWYRRDGEESYVWCPRTPAHWQHLLHGHRQGSHEAEQWFALEHRGTMVGYVAVRPRPAAGAMVVSELSLDDAARLDESLVAALIALRPGAPGVYLELGSDRPLYKRWSGGPVLEVRPGAWYVRVPNWARLLSPLIAPTGCLPIAGGELRISEYVGGVRLALGRQGISTATPWQGEDADVTAPPGVLAQLVLRYRSLDELLRAYPDLEVGHWGDALRTLFPPRPSFVRAVA